MPYSIKVEKESDRPFRIMRDGKEVGSSKSLQDAKKSIKHREKAETT